jgi:hypothetical protein
MMRDRAKVVGNVTLGGVLTRGNNTGISGTITERATVPLITIPVYALYVGTSDINVWNGQTCILSPGVYRDFHAYSNATVKLTSGQYFFRKFQCEPDVKLQFAIAGTGSLISAGQSFLLGDRLKVEYTGTTDPVSTIQFYGNQTASMRLGMDAVFAGSVIIPAAEVIVSSRVKMKGSIAAKVVTIEPDATVEK